MILQQQLGLALLSIDLATMVRSEAISCLETQANALQEVYLGSALMRV
jgi:hypothetical protein